MSKKERGKFADWLTKQLQEYESTPEQLAERLGLSLRTIKGWLAGKTEYAVLPQDIKAKLEELFDRYFDGVDEEILGGIKETRPRPTSIVPIDIDEQIAEILSEESNKNRTEPSAPKSHAHPANEGGFVELPCSKCGWLMRGLDERCPKCGRVQDESH